MLRISKLTDYGTLLMAFLARDPQRIYTARDIAQRTHLALPTVSKLLKLLARGGLLLTQRGVNGGYSLAQPADNITLAQVIAVLEGDIGLTECSHNHQGCNIVSLCALRNNWRTISEVIRDTLNNISLAEMAQPDFGRKLRTKKLKLPAVLKTAK